MLGTIELLPEWDLRFLSICLNQISISRPKEVVEDGDTMIFMQQKSSISTEDVKLQSYNSLNL